VRRLTEAERREAAERVARGESLRDVADRLGVSHTTIRRLVVPGAPPAPAPAGSLADRLETIASALADCDCPAEAATIREAAARLAAVDVREDDDHDPIGDLPDGLSAAETASELLGRLRLAHRRAESVGDVRGAGYAARTIASVLPAAARLARQAQEDGDMIRIPRAEFEAGQAAYRERVAAIVARPLTCARCGAILRAEAAGVELPAALPAGAM
jgi:transcriptional regulator with XRE-family HTH domain